MTNFARILESKRLYRSRLALLPIGQKLRMLDALRERQLTIRGHITDKAGNDRGLPDRSRTALSMHEYSGTNDRSSRLK